MIRIDENGEVIINGQKISELTKDAKTKTINKTVVIKNGEVVQDDFAESGEPFDVQAFQNLFAASMGQAFSSLQEETKVKCEYCGSAYKSSNVKCPNCGANNNSI